MVSLGQDKTFAAVTPKPAAWMPERDISSSRTPSLVGVVVSFGVPLKHQTPLTGMLVSDKTKPSQLSHPSPPLGRPKGIHRPQGHPFFWGVCIVRCKTPNPRWWAISFGLSYQTPWMKEAMHTSQARYVSPTSSIQRESHQSKTQLLSRVCRSCSFHRHPTKPKCPPPTQSRQQKRQQNPQRQSRHSQPKNSIDEVVEYRNYWMCGPGAWVPRSSHQFPSRQGEVPWSCRQFPCPSERRAGVVGWIA